MALTRPSFTQLTTTITSFTDPITVLNQGASSPNVDVGFLFNRANGLVSNVALIWSESAQSFITAYTSNTGITNTNVSATSYANVRTGNITANGFFWSNGAVFSSGTTFTGGYVPSTIIAAANLVANSGVASSSNVTGALVVSGGIGVSGSVNVGSNLVFSNTSNPGISKPLVTRMDLNNAGGLDANGPFWSGYHFNAPDGIIINGSTGYPRMSFYWNYNSATNPNNINFNMVAGNNATGGNANVTLGTDTAGYVRFLTNNTERLKIGGEGNVVATSTTTSTSTTTGAMVVKGGAGIAGALYIANTGDVSANIGTLYLGNISTQSNLGAYQNTTNANIGTLFLGNASTQANLGAYQNTTNANLGTATTNITTLFSNAATQATSINTLDANLGTATTNVTTLFSNAATQQTQINSLATNANANVAAYLPGYTGSLGSITTLTTSGNTVIGGNLNVSGNLNVAGTTTTFSSNNVSITDALLYLADGNTGDVLDIGIVSAFTNPGYQHTGFVRDASDGVWKLFANVVAEPTTTVDFTNAIYSPLRIGALTATSGTYSGAIIASTVSAGTIGNAGATLTGTLSTAAQTSVTSVGTLTGLTVSGTTALATTTASTLNTTSGNATTFVATNFSSGNIYFTNATSGTVSTSNVSLYESVTATTTSGTFYPVLSGIATGNTASFTAAGLVFNPSTGNLVLAGTTATTSTTTGALVVGGGIGVAGQGVFGGNLTVGNMNQARANLLVFGGNLNAGVGSSIALAEFYATDTNGSYLRILHNRHAQGADWTSANTRIQQRIDITDQGYIEFNPVGATYGVAIGSGTTEIMRLASSGNVVINGTTASTSTTTGVLVIKGGAGIAGQVTAGNIVTTSGVYWSNGSAYSSGSASFTGGYVANQSTFGANLVANSATNSSSNVTGAVVVAGAGGLGVGGNVYVGNRVGYVWGANSVSSAYTYFNSVTNSIDTVFGL